MTLISAPLALLTAITLIGFNLTIAQWMETLHIRSPARALAESQPGLTEVVLLYGTISNQAAEASPQKGKHESKSTTSQRFRAPLFAAFTK
jgi:hypothetical protein